MVKHQQKKQKKIKKKIKSKLYEITTENLKHRVKDQSDAIKNINNIYNSRKKGIKLYNDYPKIISEAMYKIKHGERLKILTSKQML